MKDKNKIKPSYKTSKFEHLYYPIPYLTHTSFF